MESRALAAQLDSTRAQLAEVSAENADLRAELNAFDPAFFDEIEELKQQHYLLGGKVRRAVCGVVAGVGRGCVFV
jgi:chorismate synthase